MVTLMFVVLEEGLDVCLKVAGQEVVFHQDAALQGLPPALNLALSLGMARGSADVAHLPGFDVFHQLAGDVAETVIAEQPGFVQHRGAVTTRSLEGDIKPVSHIIGVHGGAQLPGDDSEIEALGRSSMSVSPPF